MNSKRYILFSLFLFAHACLLCQSASPALSGKLQDSAGLQPIRYGTVIIKKVPDQVVKSIVTSDSGLFSFPLPPPGQYLVNISAVGYATKIISLGISDSTLPVDMGTILMITQSKTLAGVTVTAQPPLIKQEIDRLAYDVQADPENKINSVLEMLRKVPLVTVDAEDNIQLKGNSNFRILINGKPSALVSGNPKEVLRTMPASTIEKIEVITIPPAKYEAEGLAGIINIITNKKIDDGYKGTVNVNYRLPVAGPGAGSSFSIKKGKWGVNFSGGISRYHGPEQQSSTYRETSGQPATVLLINNNRVFDGSYAYGGTELSYTIDSLQLIAAEFNFNDSKQDFSNRQVSGLTGEQEQPLQTYRLTNQGGNTWNSSGIGINYQLGFKKQKKRLLTFSYKYNHSGNGQQNGIHISDVFNYPVPDYQQRNQSDFTEQTLQLDYTQPLSTNGTIEAGVKGIMRNNKSDFRYLSKDSSTGAFTEIPAYTNSFNNTQSVWGGYASLQYVFNNWNLKAGLRTERTVVDANFISTASGARQQYFNVIPSLSVQRKSGSSSLNIGYTQRIQRPGINQLNPFVDRSVPNFESTGNPGLRPVLSNNIEISFSRIKKTTVVTSLSYSFVNNNIQQAVIYQGDSKITRSFYDNIGRDKTLAGNVNITWPVSAKCNITIAGVLGYVWLQGNIDGQPVRNSGIKGSIRTGITYTFNKGWRISENLNYYTPFINLQGTTSHYLNPSLSISKEIKQFSFSASAINYFSTYFDYDTKTAGTNFNQLIHYRYFYRTIAVSINYRFGKLTKQIEKNKRGINNDDLSSGNSQ